jgi:hypothetical protein
MLSVCLCIPPLFTFEWQLGYGRNDRGVGVRFPVDAKDFSFLHNVQKSRDDVGIATGYGLDDRGVRVCVPVGSRIFSSPCSPDRLWGPSGFYTLGTGGCSQRQSGKGVKLITHHQLVAGLRKCGSIHPLPHTPTWRSA